MRITSELHPDEMAAFESVPGPYWIKEKDQVRPPHYLLKLILLILLILRAAPRANPTDPYCIRSALCTTYSSCSTYRQRNSRSCGIHALEPMGSRPGSRPGSRHGSPPDPHWIPTGSPPDWHGVLVGARSPRWHAILIWRGVCRSFAK